jgi:RNA polymerase sigma factor (TIGR02999 family)
MTEVTRILQAIDEGDPSAVEQLLPQVYDQLRQLAASRLRDEKPGQTLQPTALVHEAFVRLVDVEKTQHWNSRGHFFAAAAEAMRRILIENARRKGRQKRGGDWRRVDVDCVDLVSQIQPDELLRLDEAIRRLAEDDPTAAKLVELRYFAGLSIDDAAAAAHIGVSTAYRHWSYARAWLHSELLDDVG